MVTEPLIECVLPSKSRYCVYWLGGRMVLVAAVFHTASPHCAPSCARCRHSGSNHPALHVAITNPCRIKSLSGSPIDQRAAGIICIPIVTLDAVAPVKELDSADVSLFAHT